MILLMGAKDDAQILSVATQLDAMQQEYSVFDSSAFFGVESTVGGG